MGVSTGLVVILAALVVSVCSDQDNTPDPSKARLAVYCSKAFIWAGSINKSQPIIKEIISTYYNVNNKKAIAGYKKILDKHKNDIGDSGNNMYQCMNDLALAYRFEVQDFGECRKIFNPEDIMKLLIPIVLKDLKVARQIKKDVKNAITSKYKCEDPENKHKTECLLPQKYDECAKTNLAFSDY
ncbi:uncharacterized protein LOC126882803 [Diabrotica virgifera virgifera]|uniref:Uncharacterized protein n=1 Tax=Diabrotica virgifera virgifera TaxID=50390 RepID=A0ABM5K0W2_DIAVI|nr:uncharacterized protein LOC126882803 [Diabrotica virgifera virgifera]